MAGGFIDTRSAARHRSSSSSGHHHIADTDCDDDVLFVMGENNSIYELSASTTSLRREPPLTAPRPPQQLFDPHSNANPLGASTISVNGIRPSSVVMLHQSDVPHSNNHHNRNNHHITDSTNTHDSPLDRQSWWDDAAAHTNEQRSWFEVTYRSVHALILFSVPAALVLVLLSHDRRVLVPLALSVVIAIANFEFAWLAYRVSLRLFLPFKLHQKQTCRDIYTQIMTFSVDLETCAITPLADRYVGGHKRTAATVVAAGASGVVFGTSVWAAHLSLASAFSAASVFAAVFTAALAPNVADGVALALRTSFFALATLPLVLESRAPTTTTEDSDVVFGSPFLQPLGLAFVTASLLVMNRVVTCKDAMESALLALLDVVGLVLVGGFASVFATLATNAVDATQVVFVLAIAFAAEGGAFVTERLLWGIDFPWNHPVVFRVSTHQNYEKLGGAVVGGVCATYAAVTHVEFAVERPVIFAVAGAAIVLSHVTKLLLLSLKKIARVEATGDYLAVGGGVLDRIDTPLVIALVLGPVLTTAAAAAQASG